VNELKQVLERLFGRLSLLYGLLFHLGSQLRNFDALFRRSIDESNIDLSYIGAGARLVIRDLVRMSEDDEKKLLPLKGFVTRGEEYLGLAEVIIHRESAWTVSQGYEAFETFLYDMLASFLMQNSDGVDLKKLQKYEDKVEKMSQQDKSCWGRYVRWAYRRNREVFKRLRYFASLIESVERKNAWGFDLQDWYSVATMVRHAVTHSNSVIRDDELRGLPPKREVLLEGLFPGSYSEGGYSIEIGQREAQKALEVFAEYAYVIFVGLSEAMATK
jgi:hypothetical protein